MREWMEKTRKDRKMTMKDTARKLDISESYYSMIERGERQAKLDISLASKLSVAFGVSLEFIVTQESLGKTENANKESEN